MPCVIMKSTVFIVTGYYKELCKFQTLKPRRDRAAADTLRMSSLSTRFSDVDEGLFHPSRHRSTAGVDIRVGEPFMSLPE